MSRGTRLISISTVALGIWASSMIGPVAAQDASKAGGLNNGMKLSSDQPIQIDSDASTCIMMWVLPPSPAM